ncbi:uncharacterized protein FIBRA_02800 [Fibroporia radiculosa]|uniref:Uncharacterized protein n=1 Tax=Fibroporia radiculosa TaxID=599839 RepID=J4GN47_9APHY|nr:uncharacterized protein FIBRA_02800 [Fibroporia radiculosa]CCM00760.1 predicted protein [Fibroporia radiculosa]
MELLKEFEESSVDDDMMLDEEEEETDGSDLAHRLHGLDLDLIPPDELWNALTPAERDRFLKTIQDPDGDLAQQLLSSEELEKARIEPWWEAPVELESDDAWTSSTKGSTGLPAKKYGTSPKIMHIPASLVRSSLEPGKTPLLLYNLCSVVIVYAYLTRYFSISPISVIEKSEREEGHRIITQLLPFLTDRKSTVVHSSLSGAITDLWSRFTTGQMSSAFFAILLSDAAKLIRPLSVSLISSPSSTPSDGLSGDYSDLNSHPSANILQVLSDLSGMFDEPTHADDISMSSVPVPRASHALKHSHTKHKLTFYAAHTLSVPNLLLRALADEIAVRAGRVARENTYFKDDKSTERARGGNSSSHIARTGGSRIEEVNE